MDKPVYVRRGSGYKDGARGAAGQQATHSGAAVQVDTRTVHMNMYVHVDQAVGM